MTTETPAGTVATDDAVAATPISVDGGAPTASASATPVAAGADAGGREDQWRMAQLLTAIVTPILGLISVIFNLAGTNTYANIAGVLAIVTGAAAAMIAGEMWRLRRSAAGESSS